MGDHIFFRLANLPPAKPVKRLVAGHFNFLTGINRMIYVLKLNNYKYILVEKPNKERESHFCYYILLFYMFVVVVVIAKR